MQRKNLVSLLWTLLILLLVLGLANWQPGQAQAALAMRQVKLAQARQQPQEAAQALQRLLGAQPWRTDLIEQIGTYLEKAGDQAGAAAAYESALAQQALSADGSLRLAELWFETGQDVKAEQLLLELTTTKNLMSAAYPQAVRLLEKVAQPNEILDALAGWLEVDSTNGKALFLKGVYLAATRPADAALALEQAKQKADGYQASSAQFLEVLDSAAKEKDPGKMALEIGRGLAELNEWKAAEAAFDQAVAAQPDLAEGWAYLAEARQNLGKPAQEQIDRALQISPHSGIVQALTAIYWRRMGKPEVGLVHLYAAARQEPDSAYWQVELGKTLCELNNPQDALNHFILATELEPKNSRSWVELARFSLNFGIEPTLVGLPAARQAVYLAPKDADALDILGALLLSQNDLPSAERFLQQSLQQDAANSDAQLHLGQYYLASGNPESARPYLEEAVRLSPETAVGKLAERLIQQNYPNR
ncbi:MAG TPA: tetratricopeptide repeat protein [Longilinea sp.]|nr:tetratricopeptide repeat protein [Longilinea sp.]